MKMGAVIAAGIGIVATVTKLLNPDNPLAPSFPPARE